VSLGVQALDDQSLKELGRLHTAQEALDAVAIRARLRPLFVRSDLCPSASDARGLGRRTQARDLGSGRTSVCCITDIEPGTPFFGLH